MTVSAQDFEAVAGIIRKVRENLIERSKLIADTSIALDTLDEVTTRLADYFQEQNVLFKYNKFMIATGFWHEEKIGDDGKTAE
jgi:hypothetical protein